MGIDDAPTEPETTKLENLPEPSPKGHIGRGGTCGWMTRPGGLTAAEKSTALRLPLLRLLLLTMVQIGR